MGTITKGGSYLDFTTVEYPQPQHHCEPVKLSGDPASNPVKPVKKEEK